MNYRNEEQLQNNNRIMKRINYNSNNVKIASKNKLKSENNNSDNVEFKSQDNLIFLKNNRPIQNIEPFFKNDKTNIQKQLYNSNNNIINRNNENYIPQQSNKSNSSIKINTKINCKKYFATNSIKKLTNNNSNNQISSNNCNIIYPGQNSVKIKGKKMIKHYNNNLNNNLMMTKSSIQISGNYPLNQSQNLYNTQSRIESMELNIKGNNSSLDKKILENRKIEKLIQNRYIDNENYKNKAHLVNREPINQKNFENNNSYNNEDEDLTYNLRQNTNIVYNKNLIEDSSNENIKKFNQYNSNNSYGSYGDYNKGNHLMKSSQVESDKNIHFFKNNNNYNNIFFYNSNTNNEEKNSEDKNNFQCRDNDIINDDFEFNEYNNNIINFQKKYDNNNEILDYDIDDNKIKNKYIYKKTGNINEKKLIKMNSSHMRANELENIEQKIIRKITNKERKIKNNKNEDLILKNQKNYEIKKNRNLNNNYKYDKKENKNTSKKMKINKNIEIKTTEIKNKLKNSYDIIDFKLKIPDKEDYEKEVIISINIKKDNISEKISDILNKYSLDKSYFEPLFSIMNNSINILNNINDIQFSKSIIIDNKNDNLSEKSDDNSSSKENSEINFLDYSVVFDLIQNKIYKEYIEDIYSDIDEINENAKILNRSI